MASFQKLFVSPETQRLDSYRLASKIVKDGFHPDFMVAIWRGGASIGICVHEFLKYKNINTDHISIRTSRYTGIDETADNVAVHNLGYLVERLTTSSKVLLVDDVFDSGKSIAAIFDELRSKCGDNTPSDIRVATIYYKPTRNVTDRVPEYYVTESSEWIVFPHELEALTLEEIAHSKGAEVAELLEQC